jgi:hypothetical protein
MIDFKFIYPQIIAIILNDPILIGLLLFLDLNQDRIKKINLDIILFDSINLEY